MVMRNRQTSGTFYRETKTHTRTRLYPLCIPHVVCYIREYKTVAYTHRGYTHRYIRESHALQSHTHTLRDGGHTNDGYVETPSDW